MTEIPDRMVELGAEAWCPLDHATTEGPYPCRLCKEQVGTLLTAARVPELLELLDEADLQLKAAYTGLLLCDRIAALNAELGRTLDA